MFKLISSLLVAFVFFFISTTVYAKTYSSRLCQMTSQFTCHTVKRGENWKTLFPNETERDTVMALNRVNIIYPGMRLAIPKNRYLTRMDFSPFAHQIAAPGKKLIIVSLNDLAFGAYSPQGTLQYWGPVSGGQNYCADVGRSCRTAAGRFAIYSKQGAGCYSTKFPVGRGGAPMPYCMFFHGGFAMHGSYDVPGYNASHGCVRMFVGDAKWLNQEFVTERGVAVIISR
jgi:L,D-transpeptidase ErfK/SrfK